MIRTTATALMLCATLAACSTAGGMYSEGDPVNGQFSGWKTAGAVLLGVVTLGAVGAAAYAGASQPGYTQPSYSDSGYHTYVINGQYVTCNTSGSFTNCY